MAKPIYVFLAKLLPDLDRVLYLDADVVVVDDLRALYATDLGSNVVAAAPDLYRQYRLAAFGLSGSQPYVNAGVLLIDLARWRRESLTDRLVRFVERSGPQLELHDQDALNAVAAAQDPGGRQAMERAGGNVPSQSAMLSG